MAAPVITFTDMTSANLASLSFGNLDAGSTSSTVSIMVWNNKGGGTVLSDTTQTTITTKTFNGQDVGDTVANGQEVVSYLILGEQCTSQGDTGFTQVGGPTSAPIGSTVGGVGVIKGSTNGDAAVINLRCVVPSNVTPVTAQWLLRVSYLYS